MRRLSAFQLAAREGGFVEVGESADATTLWLTKTTNALGSGSQLRMCIDSVTSSVTIFWMTVSGARSSKTFRGVASLQGWLRLKAESNTVQRVKGTFDEHTNCGPKNTSD
jgi:hypothetical protein